MHKMVTLHRSLTFLLSGSLIYVYVLPVLLLKSTLTLTHAMQLDIHLKLRASSCLYQTANIANTKLHEKSNTEQISFNQTLPHVTLYLTEFDNNNITDLVETLKSSDLTRQLVEIDDVMVNSAYAMYHVNNNPSIHQISDTIVQLAKEFITPNQTVPEWVYNLPEPARSRKIEYVTKYGSPNVLEEFDPHLTVGYDSDESLVKERRDILSEVLDGDGSCIKDVMKEIGVGVVGSWGTVVYDLIVIDLNGVDEDKDQTSTF